MAEWGRGGGGGRRGGAGGPGGGAAVEVSRWVVGRGCGGGEGGRVFVNCFLFNLADSPTHARNDLDEKSLS